MDLLLDTSLKRTPMQPFFILMLSLFLACFFSATPSLNAAEMSFYVSPGGNDSWSGTLHNPDDGGKDGPFASISRAQERVRELIKAGALSNGVTVYIRNGAYTLSEPLSFTEEDSGTPSAPVVWRAHPGEKVQIVGGREISGFKPVTDPSVLGRMDASSRDHIVSVDLKALGISDYGEITRRGGPGLELFFNDRQMTLARWPNEGWTTIADVPQTGELVFKGVLPHMRFDIPVGRHYGRFTFEGDRPRRWSHVDDIFLHGYWTWDWYDSVLRVKAIDTERRVFLVIPDGTIKWWPEDWDLVYAGSERIDMPVLAQTWGRPPGAEDIFQQTFVLDLYEIVSPASPANLTLLGEDGSVPIGEGSYPYLREGFHPLEVPAGGRPFRWTTGDSLISLPWDQETLDLTLWLDISGGRPQDVERTRITVFVEGERVLRRYLPKDFEVHRIEIPIEGLPNVGSRDLEIRLAARTWQPGGEDPRTLGVMLYGVGAETAAITASGETGE